MRPSHRRFEEAPACWLLVSTATGGATASLRVTVWRRLRGLGALPLQQSVYLLPDLPEVALALAELQERVLREGGRMRQVHVRIDDPREHDELVAELCAARDQEYAEILERLPSLLAELEHERRRGRLTFEELQENEIDLERFRSWLGKVAARDYFGAVGRAQVEKRLQEAAAALGAFEAEAIQASGSEAPSGCPGPRAARTEQ